MNTADIHQGLLCRLDKGVLWLTVNRPEQDNLLSADVCQRLVEKFGDAHTNVNVQCVVLTAVGERYFCAGCGPTDARRPLAESAALPPEAERTVDPIARVVDAMVICEKSIILALNGTAARDGTALVLAADVVIAADHAQIVELKVGHGLVPESGTAFLLSRLVGIHVAKELVFFGDDLSVADAERLGIVNRVVPRAELVRATQEWAARLAANSVGYAKEMRHDGLRLPRSEYNKE